MISLISNIHKNPVGRTFLGLIFAFIFGTAALFLTVFAPDQLGKVDAPYQLKEIYKFDQWTINYDFLTLDFPEGGYIIPGYRADRITNMLIIAKGTATFEASDSFKESSDIKFPFVDQVSELIVPIHHEDFDRLKRDTIFIEEEISYPARYLLERLESSKKLLFNLNVMGMDKHVPPTPRSVMLTLNTSLYGNLSYKEDKVIYLSSDNLNYSYNHPIAQNIYPSPHIHKANLLYNLTLMFAFLGLVAFLTTDFEFSNNIKQYIDAVPAFLHVIGLAIYMYLFKWITLNFSLNYSFQLLLILLPTLYLGYWLYIGRVPLTDVGVTYEKIIKCIVISVTIFYLLFLATTFELIPPQFNKISTLLSNLFLIIITQFILRCFIQNILEAFLGKWGGLLVTSILIAGLFVMEAWLFTNSNNLHLVFSGYLSLSMIISYSYQRTNSILTPSLQILLLSQFITNLI